VALATLLLVQPAFAIRERTVSYYGYIYGSDGVYCACRIGPCGYDDLLGEKTFYCDGTTSSWGITEGCFTRTETTYGDYCYQEVASGTHATTDEADQTTRRAECND
jgi:hypothetical protein